jgi:AcrR family transcriptional regulator
MKPREKSRATKALVWERPEPAKRAAPAPLTRDGIVRAAIALADADGLAAVSLRKVGASLDAGPMRLYGYLSTKEELLELMVDAVYEEMAAAGPVRGGWRRALKSIAQRTRQAARAHKWFSDLLGGRPHLGPHALAHLEAALAALADTPGFDGNNAILALSVFNAYVIGAIRNEASELRAAAESGMEKTEWQAASWPYLQRMIATGRFPALAKTVREVNHPTSDQVFNKGLECVLDGIAARFVR